MVPMSGNCPKTIVGHPHPLRSPHVPSDQQEAHGRGLLGIGAMCVVNGRGQMNLDCACFFGGWGTL